MIFVSRTGFLTRLLFLEMHMVLDIHVLGWCK